MVTLGAARQISPLIRFARWTALFAGVAYGYKRYNYLAHAEVDIQKHENEIKAKHAARKAIEKEAYNKAEMESLGKEAGVVAK